MKVRIGNLSETKKISFIKLHRELTGFDLADSKQAIDDVLHNGVNSIVVTLQPSCDFQKAKEYVAKYFQSVFGTADFPILTALNGVALLTPEEIFKRTFENS